MFILLLKVINLWIATHQKPSEIMLAKAGILLKKYGIIYVRKSWNLIHCLHLLSLRSV